MSIPGASHDHLNRVLFDEAAILSRLDELAARITADYEGKSLTVVAVLHGSLMMMADLLRRIRLPLKMECLSVESYHGGVESTGSVTFNMTRMPELSGEHVLIVDDILDTGRQLRTLAKELGENFDDNAGVRQLKTTLQELFDELANIGCSYRDWNFEIGLIDFPAVIEGDDVLLCWRSDEPELLYYHGIDEGYAGRKPIPESCRS